MMRCLVLLIFISTGAFAQQDSLMYHPSADAKLEITTAVDKAKKEQKHVMLMIGGNWCRWCRMFEKFRLSDAKVDSTVQRDFVWLHVNYSKENKNLAVLKSLSYPQRFGFPVFVVLDGEGKLLHTQNSSYLEEGEGYSTAKVVDFLHQWRREALLEENYR
jgi:thiol:disulfide interchange protein